MVEFLTHHCRWLQLRRRLKKNDQPRRGLHMRLVDLKGEIKRVLWWSS